MSPRFLRNAPCLAPVLSGEGHKKPRKTMKIQRNLTRFFTYRIVTHALSLPPVGWEKKKRLANQRSEFSACTRDAVLAHQSTRTQCTTRIGVPLGSCLVRPSTWAPVCRCACGARMRRAAYIEFVRGVDWRAYPVDSWAQKYVSWLSFFWYFIPISKLYFQIG